MWADFRDLADGRLHAWTWWGEDTYAHYLGEMYCELVGAIGTRDVYAPVVQARGWVYHSTPTRERAERIMSEGFSLREVLHGRSHGDGVYTRLLRNGSGYGPLTVRVLLDGVILVDGAKSDEFGRLSSAVGGAGNLVRTLLDVGIQGMACAWGAVIYDPGAAVPELLGHWP